MSSRLTAEQMLQALEAQRVPPIDIGEGKVADILRSLAERNVAVIVDRVFPIAVVTPSDFKRSPHLFRSNKLIRDMADELQSSTSLATVELGASASDCVRAMTRHRVPLDGGVVVVSDHGEYRGFIRLSHIRNQVSMRQEMLTNALDELQAANPRAVRIARQLNKSRGDGGDW